MGANARCCGSVVDELPGAGLTYWNRDRKDLLKERTPLRAAPRRDLAQTEKCINNLAADGARISGRAPTVRETTFGVRRN
jgi:hypothetical protein